MKNEGYLEVLKGMLHDKIQGSLINLSYYLLRRRRAVITYEKGADVMMQRKKTWFGKNECRSTG
ncbi:MAG: hypothetical protein ACLTW9_18520 [Enterocloster sp.]